ncbi:MAG: hypothetical protein GKR93_19400 [Gammaproteobacteria bacterium]|nr:hypothetical protein [Gammaproteobacteria bacterium]
MAKRRRQNKQCCTLGKRNVGGEIKAVEKLNIEYIFEVDGKTHKGTTATFYTLMYPETVDFANEHPGE